MKGIRQLAVAGALGLLLTGCAGYRLGPVNHEAAGARSIQIDPFVNKTLQPRLSDYINNSLRKNLQQDGTFRLDSHEHGDIVVTGVLTAFTSTPMSVQPSDVLTPLDYLVTMTAQVKATERATGKVVFDGVVTGRTRLRAGQDLTSAERQAIPLLADDFARNATRSLTEGSW
jgi:hypothetical protein